MQRKCDDVILFKPYTQVLQVSTLDYRWLSHFGQLLTITTGPLAVSSLRCSSQSIFERRSTWGSDNVLVQIVPWSSHSVCEGIFLHFCLYMILMQLKMESRQFPNKTVPRHGFWRQFLDRFEDSSLTLFENSSPTLLFSQMTCDW